MRSVRIFSVLIFYILLQFAWWSYLLIKLNNEVYYHRIENVYLKYSNAAQAEAEEQKLIHKLHTRYWMIVGEGFVFLSLLGWVTWQTVRSVRKEVELARMQKNFLLSITHEFKSPLASIKLYLQTLQKHELDKEKTQSFIAKAIADTERLDTLVENTLLANLIDHKGYSFNREEVNLSALTRLVIQKFNSIPEQRHKITATVEEGIMIHGDKLALMLMMTNLVENADKYSPAGTDIDVTLKKIPGQIIFSVADQGHGIPNTEKQKIFKKFYRLGNEETRRTKGTGLGLFIVKYIAKNHRGKILVKNNRPEGSIFEIQLEQNTN